MAKCSVVDKLPHVSSVAVLIVLYNISVIERSKSTPDEEAPIDHTRFRIWVFLQKNNCFQRAINAQIRGVSMAHASIFVVCLNDSKRNRTISRVYTTVTIQCL